MAKNYYLKELVSNRIFVNGKQIEFMHLPDNRGVVELDTATDAVTVAHLDQLAQRHKLGVVAITSEEFEEWKKKAPSRTSKPRSPLSEPLRVHNPLRTQPPSQQQPKLQDVVAAAVDAAIEARTVKKVAPETKTNQGATDEAPAPVTFKPAVGAKQPAPNTN